jgi:hypothetical protein
MSMPATAARSGLSESARIDFPSLVRASRTATRLIAVRATATATTWLSESRTIPRSYTWKTSTSKRRGRPPHCMKIRCRMTSARPIDVMKRLMIPAPLLRIGRQRANSRVTPRSAVTAMANTTAAIMWPPQLTLTRKAMNAPNVRYSPWAKLTIFRIP